MPFSLESIKRALQRGWERITQPLRPGGYLGRRDALTADIGTAAESLLQAPGKLIFGGQIFPTYYETGRRTEIPPAGAFAAPGMPEPRRFEPMPLERAFLRATAAPVFTPAPTERAAVPTPAIRPTPTLRPEPTALAPTFTPKPLEMTPKPALAPALRPVEIPRPLETAPRPAPRADVLTPPAPRVAGGAPAAPITGLAGFGAPAPAGLPPTPALPPTPTLPAEMPPAAPTPENMAKFEALIRALQELGAGAYAPMPTLGGEPFGPAGALSRALKRIRERELGELGTL